MNPKDMKSLFELIADAQETLDKIVAHDGFVEILESELWEDPAITMSDAKEALEALQKAYEEINQEKANA